MERNEIRNIINHYLIDNKINELNERVAKDLYSLLRSNYKDNLYGNVFEINCEFDELFEIIKGDIKRCDPFEKTHVIDKVDFNIDSKLEVMAYDKDNMVLNLDMDNLSKNDLIDIKNISPIMGRIDLYKTFMRIKPEQRGALANMIENCVSAFRNDIPPYAFYKYSGLFLSSSNRMTTGFIAIIKEKGSVLEIDSNVLSIGEHAFDTCENLKQVIIKGNIQYIGKHAFSNNKDLVIHVYSETSKPSTWDDEWCDSNCKVVWKK